MTVFVGKDRWHGVPFRLRTGKALGADRREIAIRFRTPTDPVFGKGTPPLLSSSAGSAGPEGRTVA